MIDTLDLYAPALKGLTDVHAYACETLESIIFDQQKADQRGQAAAFLYGTYMCCGCGTRSDGYDMIVLGQAMAMSTLTSEAVTLAIENLYVAICLPRPSTDVPSTNLLTLLT